MAKIDTIQLSDNNFVNVGTENIVGLVVSNTHTSDIGFDLMLGDPILAGGTDTTDAIFILKSIPIPTGSTFVWDDDNVLSGVFESGSLVSVFNTNINSFEKKKGLTFLLRLDTGSTTASVVLRRQ
jgi:hypothetical protein|tara:strand:- start:62 stop:436 length:375 start_codon:yes stop_codon:yes gene_type:complete